MADRSPSTTAGAQLADRIAAALLGVGRARYKTPECRNVALGAAVEAFGRFFDAVGDRAAVLRFVRRQCTNRRPSTRVKAERFLARHVG